MEPDLRQAGTRAAGEGVVEPLVDRQPGLRVEPDAGHRVEWHGAAQYARPLTDEVVAVQIAVCETEDLAADRVVGRHLTPWDSEHDGEVVPVRPFTIHEGHQG